MSEYDIAVIAGDGIGPEVTREGLLLKETAPGWTADEDSFWWINTQCFE